MNFQSFNLYLKDTNDLVFFKSSEREFHILGPMREKVSIPVFINCEHRHDHAVSRSYEDRLSDNFPMEINRRNLAKIWYLLVHIFLFFDLRCSKTC